MRKKLGSSVVSIIAGACLLSLMLTGCTFDDRDPERIKLAMMQPPAAALNPYSDDVAKLSRWSTGETLVRLDDDIEIEPLLATKWEQTDEFTWVFTLHKGVTFHDGTPFNAEAVKNSLDHAVEATTPPRAIKGVEFTTEVTGEYEVTITTEEPDPLLTNRLASPQLSIFSDAAYQENGIVTPVGTGTGPFELVEVNGTTTATLDRYEDYWGDVAKAKGIDVDFVPDGTARAGAIRSGEVDVAESIPVSQVILLDPAQVHEVVMPRTTLLALNSDKGPFADPEVRAAAAAAIDRKAIVDNVYEGQADPAVGLLGPAIAWAEEYRKDIEPTAAPKQVDGTEITLATYTDRTENPNIAVQLEAQLENAGFVVNQEVREYVNIEEDMLAGSFDAVIASRNILLDTGDPLSFISQDFTCKGGFNVAQLCSPEVDEIVARGLQTTGEKRRKATLEAEAAILRLNSGIPLVHERVVQAEAGTFSNFVRDPLERRLITEYTSPTGELDP